MGGRGTFIQLYGTEGIWGCYLVEIPQAAALNPERHLYEEIFFVVEGRGAVEIWQEDGGRREILEWQPGSLFTIPLNTHHRLLNATASGPALLLAGPRARVRSSADLHRGQGLHLRVGARNRHAPLGNRPSEEGAAPGL